MNTEQLKMIVDMINGLGENGKEAFFWWLTATYGTNFLLTIFVVLTLAITVRFVALLVFRTHNREEMNPLTRLQGAARDYWVSKPGEAQGAYAIYKAVEEEVRREVSKK